MNRPYLLPCRETDKQLQRPIPGTARRRRIIHSQLSIIHSFHPLALRLATGLLQLEEKETQRWVLLNEPTAKRPTLSSTKF